MRCSHLNRALALTSNRKVMVFDKFVEEVHRIWEHYLGQVADFQQRGQLDSKGGIILYPNILLVTNCSGYYIAELVGAVTTFDGLKIKRHKEKSIYRYFSQFDDSEPDSLAHLDSEKNGFRFLCLAQEYDAEQVERRFPAIELYGSKLMRTGGRGSVFSFGENFISCHIENSVLVNRSDNLYRCKNILAAYVFKSSVTKPKLTDFFQYILNESEVRGVHTVKNGNEERIMVAGQLQNMYLLPSLHETTIGEFLKLHPEIIKSAFKTEHFEYEPYLEWKEHDGTCDDVTINPDLLIKRQDGTYDIYDLKTAALAKRNLTKGGRKRRRFIDYVEEGVSQLANYREYFEYELNRQHADQKYGVVVNNPKLVLVVGNWDNSTPSEVSQARRKYPDIEIIDYDTLCHHFIGTS